MMMTTMTVYEVEVKNDKVESIDSELESLVNWMFCLSSRLLFVAPVAAHSNFD